MFSIICFKVTNSTGTYLQAANSPWHKYMLLRHLIVVVLLKGFMNIFRQANWLDMRYGTSEFKEVTPVLTLNAGEQISCNFFLVHKSALFCHLCTTFRRTSYNLQNSKTIFTDAWDRALVSKSLSYISPIMSSFAGVFWQHWQAPSNTRIVQ